MSTNPPIAVRMPRKISKTFFTPGSPVPCREAFEPSGDRLEWRGDRWEPAELITARRDPDELDHVDGALNFGQEILPDRVGARSGWLDRCERVAGRRRVGLGVGDRHSDARPERSIGGRHATDEQDGSSGGDDGLSGVGGFCLVGSLGPCGSNAGGRKDDQSNYLECAPEPHARPLTLRATTGVRRRRPLLDPDDDVFLGSALLLFRVALEGSFVGVGEGRLNDGSRPQPAFPDHVHFRGK